MYYISIRQRGKPRRRGENPMGFRDSDSLLHSLSPFLPFGAFENTGGNRRRFFIYQKRKTVPNAHCRRTGQRVSMSSCEIHRALIYSHHAAMIADYKIHI